MSHLGILRCGDIQILQYISWDIDTVNAFIFTAGRYKCVELVGGEGRTLVVAPGFTCGALNHILGIELFAVPGSTAVL